MTGDSASNGEAENANKIVQNQIRTMYDALKARFHPMEVPSDHPTLKWLIMFSGSLLTRFMVGSDGKTAFEREKGKRYKRALPEFGERIHFMPLKKSGSKLNKLEPRLKDGIFLGLRESNDEIFVGTPKGVFRCSTFYRRPEVERWDGTYFLSVVGVPWRPVPTDPTVTELSLIHISEPTRPY